ncbi:hypothetical protein BV22DRAFT_1133154 [Leucogyrophana mollusca]|uniref:Uncharacterized protein n=1 Tax=Leucogyrophana mollusca TaxID=85980 RepID=A0ACB8B5H3_9AGAM|nr:hypothetical protein BV22DRAFT_1133154 [Leucogyrophana mollusca]
MGRPRLYSSPQEAANAARLYRKTYHSKNRNSINLKAKAKYRARQLSTGAPQLTAATIPSISETRPPVSKPTSSLAHPVPHRLQATHSIEEQLSTLVGGSVLVNSYMKELCKEIVAGGDIGPVESKINEVLVVVGRLERNASDEEGCVLQLKGSGAASRRAQDVTQQMSTKWAMKEQEVWLRAYCEAHYRSCMVTKNYIHFWPAYYQAWELKWPERLLHPQLKEKPAWEPLTAAETEIESEGRKVLERFEQQLKHKMCWLATGGNRGRSILANKRTGKGQDALCTLSALSKGTRAPQAREVFTQLTIVGSEDPKLMYSDNIRTLLDEHVSSQGIAGDRAAILKARGAITKKVFAEVAPEVKALVEEKKLQMTLAKHEEKKAMKLSKQTRTPADTQASIDAMPATVAKILLNLHQLTGWSYTVLAGGPEPSNDGSLKSMSVHVGENDVGKDFGNALVGYKDKIMKPYDMFLRTAYPVKAKAYQSGDSVGTGTLEGAQPVAGPSKTTSHTDVMVSFDNDTTYNLALGSLGASSLAGASSGAPPMLIPHIPGGASLDAPPLIPDIPTGAPFGAPPLTPNAVADKQPHSDLFASEASLSGAGNSISPPSTTMSRACYDPKNNKTLPSNIAASTGSAPAYYRAGPDADKPFVFEELGDILACNWSPSRVPATSSASSGWRPSTTSSLTPSLTTETPADVGTMFDFTPSSSASNTPSSSRSMTPAMMSSDADLFNYPPSSAPSSPRSNDEGVLSLPSSLEPDLGWGSSSGLTAGSALFAESFERIALTPGLGVSASAGDFDKDTQGLQTFASHGDHADGGNTGSPAHSRLPAPASPIPINHPAPTAHTEVQTSQHHTEPDNTPEVTCGSQAERPPMLETHAAGETAFSTPPRWRRARDARTQRSHSPATDSPPALSPASSSTPAAEVSPPSSTPAAEVSPPAVAVSVAARAPGASPIKVNTTPPAVAVSVTAHAPGASPIKVNTTPPATAASVAAPTNSTEVQPAGGRPKRTRVASKRRDLDNSIGGDSRAGPTNKSKRPKRI